MRLAHLRASSLLAVMATLLIAVLVSAAPIPDPAPAPQPQPQPLVVKNGKLFGIDLTGKDKGQSTALENILSSDPTVNQVKKVGTEAEKMFGRDVAPA
ncbi:hypothetical protein K437DRAFT_259723 [Tilletiaria anomala UBC 951]|uniref:Uncharacterized protein n=1 Tax=Tilletiaria anomala (strain ATCC 24038 / CBS 436.72 / UBC 951) TaxID=1037660 RepID=A0A066VBI6_TILAU|nr:uncharacterized protein K437DRAFT_259723 [Tilletiaria anomala UBC 951]KDN37663.1 hypothetical protein K437DRAFT_259723 [Tilletiaria anomala UBC 951]